MPKIDFDKIPTVVYSQFAHYMPSMHWLFCYKSSMNNYYIFQEIAAMPAKKLMAIPSDFTIGCSASWSAWDCMDSIIFNADKEALSVWRDLLNRTPAMNVQMNSYGAHDRDWTMNMDRHEDLEFRNQHKKKKSRNRKFNTFLEFKIEKVYAFYMYQWGFEILSPSINLVAITNKFRFPYGLNDHEVDVTAVQAAKMEWNGMRFVRTQPAETESMRDLFSYWRAEEEDTEDELDALMDMAFDKDGAGLRHLEMGQRHTYLDI